MTRTFAILALLALPAIAPCPALADQLVATRTLRAKTVVAPDDIARIAGESPGALVEPGDAIGLETRAIIYAGRPIHPGDLGPPAVVERNQILPLVFSRGTLEIRTEGRALDRAGVGEVIRVMNAASRAVVNARIGADGAAHVTQ